MRKINYKRGGIELSTLAVAYKQMEKFKIFCVKQSVKMRPALDYLIELAIKNKTKIPK